MTFYEAAIEVLLKAGRPLHYKKITEAAIQEKLLSHIGRTPEMTMSERLDQEVRRTQDSPLVSTSPGVFMLREEFIQKLQTEARRKPSRRSSASRNGRASDEQANAKSGEVAREEAKEAEGAVDVAPSNGDSRRRRRRSSRSKRRNSTSQTVAAPAGSDVAVEAPKQEVEESVTAARAPSRSGRRSKTNGRRQNGNATRGRRGSREARQDTAVQQKHLTEGPVRLDGIAQAAFTVLKDGEAVPMAMSALADEIFRRKLVRFHTHDAATTVQAAMANDNQIRQQRGHRPLFEQYDKQRWGLTEWGFSESALQKEQQILSWSEEIRQDAIQHLGDAFTTIKPEAMEHIALTLLERLGYRNIKVSKRSSEGDVFFTGDWRQGLSDVRVCIEVVSNSDQELQADAVTELRGTLHHYSASEGVIIHLGSISAASVKESREEKLAPITLIDRATFVELLIKHGIGVRTYHTPIALVDMTFINALAD